VLYAIISIDFKLQNKKNVVKINNTTNVIKRFYVCGGWLSSYLLLEG